MNSYILRGIDAALRQRLTDDGVVFYEWNSSDIVVEQPQLARALATLNATGTEKATEYENMFEVQLTYGKAAPLPSAAPLVPVADAAYLKSREAYIIASSARLKVGLDNAMAVLKARREALVPLQGKAFGLARQLYVAGDQADSTAIEKRMADEYERLRQIPQVMAVRVTRNNLLIYTDTILATSPGGGKERHELGKFLFMIRTDGNGEQPFRMYNSTRRVDGIRSGMNAPYVYTDGTTMHTELQETLIELIAQFEFATATELAIQFLETVNADEPGRYITRWPLERRVQKGA